LSSLGRAFFGAALGLWSWVAACGAAAQTSAHQHSSLLAAQPDTSGDAPWAVVRGARVDVYHAPAHAALGERVARFLDAQPALPALPASVPGRVEAFLAPDADAFAALTGGAVPDWSAGVAIPSLGRLVVPVYANARALAGERVRVLRHEWAHLALHEHLALRVPRWFDEGYAEWASGWDRSEAWRLRLLLALGRAPPLDSLTLDWPRDEASARAAYLLSATAVEYLVVESGERSLALMMERWKASGSLEGALRATYGVTQGQLEEHWRAYVRRRYGWLMVLSHSMVLWSSLAVLLLLLLRVRRRRDRERLARLRAAEEADTPAYWREEEGAGDSPGEEGRV
jgi:hypothetical protein